MQIGQKYGNGFGSSPSVPVLIEIPYFMIEIWKIVRHHVLVPRPDSGHPIGQGAVTIPYTHHIHMMLFSIPFVNSCRIFSSHLYNEW